MATKDEAVKVWMFYRNYEDHLQRALRNQKYQVYPSMRNVGTALAHELAHVLMDGGEHSD